MKIYENAAAASDILKRGRFDDEEKAAAVKEIVRHKIIEVLGSENKA